MERHTTPVLIERKSFGKKEVIYFTFEGNITKEMALYASSVWQDLTADRSQPITVVWDCSQLKRYEPMARSIWQKTMKEMKAKTDFVWVISDSKWARKKTKMLSMFTGYYIRVATSFEKFEKQIAINSKPIRARMAQRIRR